MKRRKRLRGKHLLIAIVIWAASTWLVAIAIEERHRAFPTDLIEDCGFYWNGGVEKRCGYRSADLIWGRDFEPVLGDAETEFEPAPVGDFLIGVLGDFPIGVFGAGVSRGVGSLSLCAIGYLEEAELVCRSSCYQLVLDNVVAGSTTVDCESCLDRNKDGLNKGCIVMSEPNRKESFRFNAIIESVDKEDPSVARVAILEENGTRTKAIVDRVRIRDWKNVGEEVYFTCWTKSDASKIIRYEYCEQGR